LKNYSWGKKFLALIDHAVHLVGRLLNLFNTILGYMGLNAIGRGLLTVEDSTLYGNTLVNFRSDYGSTWEGDLVIRAVHLAVEKG
jgi:hypothetical protein